MSTNNLPPSDSTPNGRDITLQKGTPAEPADMQWSPVMPQVIQPQEATILTYLNALRRHWLAATGFGLLCAAIAGAAVWFLQPPVYTAAALLRVAASEQQLVFKTAERSAMTAFGIYKGTQQQLLKSPFVLTAALRKPGIAKLQVVKDELDPVVWLSSELKVTFPGDAEIMQVSLTSKDKDAAKEIVSAVVGAYMDEVVDVERNKRRGRLSELERVHAEKQAEMRSKRTELKQLAEHLGTADDEALTLKQQIYLQQFAAFRNELIKIQFEVMRAEGEIEAKKSLLKNFDELQISEYELETAARNDLIASQLMQTMMGIRNAMAYTEATAVPDSVSKVGAKQNRNMKAIANQFELRKVELLEELKIRMRARLESDVRTLAAQLEILRGHEKTLELDVGHMRQEAEDFGESSVDIQVMRSELNQIDSILAGIASERERLEVEIQSGSRITLVQPSQVSGIPDKTLRLPLTGFAMLLGFFIPGACVAFWDTRAQRVNSALEISMGLGLQVIGSVPIIPTRAIGQTPSKSKKQQEWRLRLTESIDSIVARLLRKADIDESRVLLISSATSGEGKTTLATQLAISFARAGRKTVLVDFDLRRPSMHGIFELPLEPGSSEVLRQESGVLEIVQETAAENLSVITAGQWDRHALSALANGGAGKMLDKLREEYDFVVVDGCPVLPVADTRLISQHVDSVILSVLRDVSQAPKVLAACEILEAFGAVDLGVVMTGSGEDLYTRRYGYKPRIPA